MIEIDLACFGITLLINTISTEALSALQMVSASNGTYRPENEQ